MIEFSLCHSLVVVIETQETSSQNANQGSCEYQEPIKSKWLSVQIQSCSRNTTFVLFAHLKEPQHSSPTADQTEGHLRADTSQSSNRRLFEHLGLVHAFGHLRRAFGAGLWPTSTTQKQESMTRKHPLPFS